MLRFLPILLNLFILTCVCGIRVAYAIDSSAVSAWKSFYFQWVVGNYLAFLAVAATIFIILIRVDRLTKVLTGVTLLLSVAVSALFYGWLELP